MSAGGTSKNTTNETDKGAASNSKEKLYSGVVYESVDDDKVNKSRYSHWKQKYIGDQIRAPQPLPASKRPKVQDVSSSNALSTALGYIISPVKYLASAFTFSASETDKSLQKPKGRIFTKPKELSPRPLITLSKETAAGNTTATPQNAVGTSQKSNEAPVKALKTIPLSEITATNSSTSAKSRGGSPTLNSKDKKSASKQKPGNSKKVHEIKKSQSQQIKGSPKVFKSYSPPRNADALPAVSNTKLLTANEMKIVQSNRAAFRVVSREDAHITSDSDAHTFRFEGNPALASRSNNSNVIYQMSPMTSPLKDELSFVDDPLFAYPVQNCSNSTAYNYNLADSSRHKHVFHPDFSQFRRGFRASQARDLPPTASNVADVLNISCDREAIETIFSGNLRTQCTPTQLLAGQKSQSRTALLHESFNINSTDLRETLLANENTQRLTPPHNKWQSSKDYERDQSYIIVPTGPTTKKTLPFQSPKNSSKTKAKPVKSPKTKPPLLTKRKMSKQDKQVSPSSSRTKAAFLSNAPRSPPTSRPSSFPGPNLKHTNVIVQMSPKKKEDIKKVEIKKEEMKKEEMKKIEVKKVEMKKEEMKKAEMKKEETRKTTSPATAALTKTAMVAATVAVSEAVTKAATSRVHSPEAAAATKTEEISGREASPTTTAPAAERPKAEETWLVHAIRSMSPKRKDPPHNSTSASQPSPPSSPPRHPSAPSSSMTPATAGISPKSVTITSAGATMADAETVTTQGGASMTAASAVREALKFTSAVREAMKISHSVNIMGKKRLTNLSPRADSDQDKQDDFPKYFSVSATLHGEFP